MHFNGWGKQYAEKIPVSDMPKRIRARNPATATGQQKLSSKEQVREMFGLPAYKAGALPAELPQGWEILQDSSGKVYYGNRELKKVQWEHPSEGLSSGKKHLANQYALSGAVHTVMSLRMRGKQIAPAPETAGKASENGENNNNFMQKLKMWGTLFSDLFKVVMACLLAVFVPQNCPPSETFDKEVCLRRILTSAFSAARQLISRSLLSHVICHTSLVTRHLLHLPCHTSLVTRHLSHVTCCISHVALTLRDTRVLSNVCSTGIPVKSKRTWWN